MTYFRKVATAIDQLINTFFNGWPDESLSARAYRWRRDGKRAWPAWLINKLFFWQQDHVASAYHTEQERRHFPPEYREA